MQFFFQYLHRCLISGKRRLSVCMDRKASLRLNRYRRTPNDRNFFCSRMFPKNALGNSHTAFKGDIWCAITISMQPSVTDASGANRKPPPSYGRFIKATKEFFKHLFSPVRQRYRQLCRPVFFQTVKGNYCVT